ncbi:hypothetical protein ACSSVW_002828 [Pseudoalteromonas sp. MBR-15]|jgi:hypothetical protein
MVFEEFIKKARKNNSISDDLINRVLFFSNIWTTFFAPALIGIGISYLYTLDKDENISWVFWILLIMFATVHFAVAFLQHLNSRKYSLVSEVLGLENEVQKTRDNLAKHLHALKDVSNLHANQTTTIFCLANIVDTAVGELHEMELSKTRCSVDKFDDIIKSRYEQMIRLLSLEREALFGYTSESLYNIALYHYDKSDEKLKVLVRDCDNRLQKRNREWGPGHGHVGLAFLHKRIKICPDITKSNELMNYSDASGGETKYKSFFSIPILRCKDNGDVGNGELPFGVLVLTSATSEQFEDIRDLQFLNIVVKFFAIYLAAVEAFRAHNGNLIEGDDDV